MKLKPRCPVCDKVKEAEWDVEELREFDKDACRDCFICSECRDFERDFQAFSF